MTASGRLMEATRRFRVPADELSAVLERLGAAVHNFGNGLNLGDDLAKLSADLELYADLLEGAAQRVEAAVLARAVPAMKAAETAGIEEAVRSEAITTVQVLDRTEGAVDDDRDIVGVMEQQLTLLESLDKKLEGMAGGGAEMKSIINLLETYLPALERRESGLGSQFNTWNQ